MDGEGLSRLAVRKNHPQLKRFFILTIITLSTIGDYASAQDSSFNFNNYLISERTPQWAKALIEKARLLDTYSISDIINPFYLEADFNGDNLQDIAITIENKKFFRVYRVNQ